jgi:DNA-binding transcriptional regulator YiaG
MSYMLTDMMPKAELVAILSALRLTQTEAAQLLEVSDRTVRRWLEGEEVPGPAQAALRAWRELQSCMATGQRDDCRRRS